MRSGVRFSHRCSTQSLKISSLRSRLNNKTHQTILHKDSTRTLWRELSKNSPHFWMNFTVNCPTSFQCTLTSFVCSWQIFVITDWHRSWPPHWLIWFRLLDRSSQRKSGTASLLRCAFALRRPCLSSYCQLSRLATWSIRSLSALCRSSWLIVWRILWRSTSRSLRFRIFIRFLLA